MFLSNKIRLILFLIKLYDNETFPFVNHAFATISISQTSTLLKSNFCDSSVFSHNFCEARFSHYDSV